MSPSIALENDIFRTFLVLIGGMFVTAVVILAILQWGFRRRVGETWRRLVGWLLVTAIVIACLWGGRIPTIILLCLASLLAFKEFAKATGLYRDWCMTGAAYLGIIALGASALMRNPFTGDLGWFNFFMAMPIYVITVFLMIPILRNRSRGQLQAVSLAIVGFIYVGWMFNHLAFLANSSNPYGYILFLLVAVSTNDIAAYAFGKLLGGPQLCSEISPNKTWGGALGALGVSMLLPWLFSFAIPDFGPWQRVLAGIVIGVGGQMGDLSISYIKRDIGIKDMGSGIPGHGGILDRIDSLIYVTPLFTHGVNYFYGLQ